MKDMFAALEQRGHLSSLALNNSDMIEQVENASRVSWLPIQLNVEMVEGISAACGGERGLQVLAECVYGQFDRPLWKNFIGGAVRLLGKNPETLGRWIPNAFQLIFRDCGRWSVESTGERELEISVTELPLSLAAHEAWLRSLAVGMTPLFMLCGSAGSSELAWVDVDSGSARYLLRWKQR